MTISVEDRKEVHGSEDFKKLGTLLMDYMVGKPVLRVTFAAGGELVFHLGDPQQYLTAKMRATGFTRGSWQLRIMRSPWETWTIGKPGMTIIAGMPVPWGEPLSEEKVELLLQDQFKDAKVTRVRVSAPADLAIEFSNDLGLVVLSRYAEKDPTKPLWKLATPHRMAIHVFGEPASCWSCLRSDIPRREA
jgi:hypothetical protein